MVATDLSFSEDLTTFVVDYKFVLGIAVGTLAAVDSLIASSLVYYLTRVRSGFPRYVRCHSSISFADGGYVLVRRRWSAG